MERFKVGRVIDFNEAKKRMAENKKADVQDDIELFNELDESNFVYAECIALKTGRPNQNGDLFELEEIERIDEHSGVPVYKTFVGKGVYANHASDKIENSFGWIIDSEIVRPKNDAPHIRLIVAVDRVKNPDAARGLETGRLSSFSMGCSISHSICTHCGKKIIDTKPEHLCDCLRYHRGQKLDGKYCAERLCGVVFHEISIVCQPADASARLIQVLADDESGRMLKVASIDDVVVLNMVKAKIFNGNIKDKIAMLDVLNKI